MYSILLVDDDFFALEGIRSGVHFRELGFEEVYYCTSMASACKVLNEHEVDVMVADIEMPGGSGLDLQKWALERGIKVVTLFLTCHASFEYAQDAIRLHIFDYILKPLHYADFEKRLQQALHECLRWKKERDDGTSTLSAEDRSAPISVQVKKYIDEHISENLTREDLGKSFYLNPDYLARIFKNEEGVSLTAYIRNRRIRIAQRLLRETDLGIDEISQAVGYSYNTYFFNIFKEVTGVSPSQYRKSKHV